MIKTARQLKDLIRNLSREKSADAQILMRNYMMERFLERISLSEYRDKFILKGGMLVAAMVGLDARSTMDLDATIKGANVNVEDIENLISSIVTVPIDDGVKFQLKSISEIMDEAEYPGIRVSMSTTFDGVVTPLKIDISTGDAITPREVRYSFKLMLEDRSIDIWAYNLETVLAEKLETIITRTTTNTRMRDFYDIYILEQLHGTTLNPKILHDALLATAHKRGSEKYLNQAEEVFDEVENDSVMQKLWEAYRKKFSYASDLEWDVIMKAIRRLYVLCEKGHQLMKKHGHYCKVCGEYKANEKFSGKGHASHICKSCASLPAEKQAELMTLNRLLNLPWRLSKEQLSWLKNRLKDRRPDVRALAQEQYEMRFPPRHLEDDEFNFFDEESFIE